MFAVGGDLELCDLSISMQQASTAQVEKSSQLLCREFHFITKYQTKGTSAYNVAVVVCVDCRNWGEVIIPCL